MQLRERKHSICPLGKAVKIRLLEMNKKQSWLIDELQSKLPDMYIDSSVLFRILCGEIKGGRVVDTVKNILDIKEDNT